MKAFAIPGIVGAVVLAAAPAGADEIEDALRAALEAYQAGDVGTARQEVEYATTLLQQIKAQDLEAYLPEPLDGWSRMESQANAAPMAMFGGGLTASAEYSNGPDSVAIQMMADNQMVTMMGTMLASPQMMGQMGKVERVNRQMVLVGNDGQVQALVGNRVLVQISGSASDEVKLDYFRRIDLEGLKNF